MMKVSDRRECCGGGGGERMRVRVMTESWRNG